MIVEVKVSYDSHGWGENLKTVLCQMFNWPLNPKPETPEKTSFVKKKK